MRPVTRRGGAIEHARSDQARMRSAQLELERAQTYADRAHRNSTPASPTTVSSPAPRARMGATLTQIRAAASFPAHRATSAHEDYLDVIHRAVEHCGGRVNLIGDCQGGWLATIYAALYPEHINTLTLAGAPIDFHAGEPVVHEVLRRLAPGGDLRFYEALVRADGGVLKGEHMVSGFVLIQPGAEISRQFDLLLHLDDEHHVARYSQFEDWFKHTQDVPGGFYLWIIRHLFRDNELIDGAITIRGRQVDLANISMPLYLLAGATDHITPPDQVFAIADVVSTPPELVRRHLTTGGHLGLFMGHEALREHWPPILTDVLRHSTAPTHPPAREPRKRQTSPVTRASRGSAPSRTAAKA